MSLPRLGTQGPTMARGRRARASALGRWALVGAIALAMLTIGPRGTLAYAPGPPVPLVPARAGDLGPNAVIAGAAPAGSTLGTLVLFNNTTIAGNDVNVTEGEAPAGIAYASDAKASWVTSSATNAVAEVNASNGSGVRWVPARYSPMGIVYDNTTGNLFIAEESTDNVTILNATTGAFVSSVKVGVEPWGVAYDWRTQQVYVSNRDNASVSVLNGTTRTFVRNVTVGSEPEGLAYDPAARAVVVADFETGNLEFVNDSTYSIGPTDPLPEPSVVLYDGHDDRLYVAIQNLSDSVTTVDASSGVVGPAIAGAEPATALALVPSGMTVYATDVGLDGDGTVQAIPTGGTAVALNISLGDYTYPSAVDYDAASGDLLVAEENIEFWAGYDVAEIDPATNATVGSIGLQHLPIAEAYDAGRGLVYLYDGGTGDVYAINTTTDHLERSVFVGFSGVNGCPGTYVCQGIAYDAAHDAIYVDYYNYVDYGISIVNASTFAVRSLSSGADAFNASAGIAIDPTDHEAFVADFDTANVTVIDTDTQAVVTTIPVQSHPFGVVYDSGDDLVFVSNSESGTVSVIDPGTDTVAVNITVGGMPVGEAYDPANGDIYVANAGVSSNLTILDGSEEDAIGNVNLHATGTPGEVAYDPANGTIEVTLEGTSSFPGDLSLVNTSNQSFAGLVPVGTTSVGGGIVYVADVGESFVANYLPGTVSVVRLGAAPAPTYQVSFSETGLLPGTEWGIDFNGTPETSTGSSLGFAEPNGHYPFTVDVVTGYTCNATGGTLVVDNAPAHWSLAFTANSTPTYPVTFSETGLVPGTEWEIVFNGTPETSTGTTIGLSEPTGSYPFTVDPVPDYRSNVSSGTLGVAAGPAHWSIVFTEVLFAVTFQETGLPPGTTWAVTFNGSELSSSTTSIAFLGADGSWGYSVPNASGYRPAPSNGTVLVMGAPRTVAIAFAAPTSSGPSSTFLGLPGATGYILLGATLGGAAAVVVLVVLIRRRRSPPPRDPRPGAPGPP